MEKINVTLNPSDKNGSFTLTNGNLTMTSSAGSGANIRATHGKTSGKWYWEVKLDSGYNPVFLGIANKIASITSSSMYKDLNARVYYGIDGSKYPEAVSYGSRWAVSDVIGVVLNLDNGTLEFYKNGVSMGISHTDVAGLGEVFPVFMDGSGTTKTFTVNFGATPFSYKIPKGFYSFDGNQYGSYNKLLLQSDSGEIKSLVSGGYTDNVIPTMTSANAPSGVASASSTQSSNYPYMAFDRVMTNNGWISSSGNLTNQWICYQFPEKKSIGKYTMFIKYGVADAPKEFRLEGSDDGLSWKILDERTIIDWKLGDKKEFFVPIKEIKPYIYYRIYCLNNNGAKNYLAIGEIEMMEYIVPVSSTINSLTEREFLKYGLDSLSNTIPSSSFEKKINIETQSTTLSSGKTFEHKIDLTKYKVKKIKFQ